MEQIILENITKKFYLNFKKPESALKKVKNLFLEKKKQKEFLVLDNVSFNILNREVFGIIGRNGSGKSTLLRTIAGIYKADKGRIIAKGKMVYLSGLDFGFHESLTMRENIYFTASLLGLKKKDIKKNFNHIIEFSGLSDFTDVKLSKFSTGMISRLTFSTVISCVSHLKPDILLLDEVFEGGGDEEFKYKSIKKMEELIKSGATVILVSHDKDILEKHCPRTLWLEKGKVMKIGQTNEIIKSYLNEI